MAMIAPFADSRRVDNLHRRCCHAREGGHPVLRSTGRGNGTRRKRDADAGRAIRTGERARPRFRPQCRGHDHADRTQGRPRDLPHHGLHHVRQPGDPGEGRHMDHGAVFVATCLAAALSTAIMGLYANYPIALAPGMGLDAYFAFTMVPELGGNWQLALGIVFLSGALFLLISLTPLREWLINAIPLNLKLGIAAGIGLFLALIGLQNAGLIAADATMLVKLGDLTEAKALLAIAGFLAIAGLAARKVPGAIIFGVLAVTLAAVWLGLEPWHGLAAMPPSLAPTFLKMDVAGV